MKTGLYHRYHVTKANPREDGPDDPNAVYFVLRLDSGGDDQLHIQACRLAALTYATEIRSHLPQLAEDVERLVKRLTP